MAACLEEGEIVPEVMVWAKVMTDAIGKRHIVVDIDLTDQEEAVVRSLIESFHDQHVQFCVRHECATNPQVPWWFCMQGKYGEVK